MKVGDLVWVVGRPHDGWQRFLGIIVKVAGYKYRVAASDSDTEYILDKLDLEVVDVQKN